MELFCVELEPRSTVLGSNGLGIGTEKDTWATVRGIVWCRVFTWFHSSHLIFNFQPTLNDSNVVISLTCSCWQTSLAHASPDMFSDGNSGEAQKEDQKHLLRETETTMKFGLFSMVQVCIYT